MEFRGESSRQKDLEELRNGEIVVGRGRILGFERKTKSPL